MTGAGSSGIYLETGSRAQPRRGQLLIDNGYRENGPGGQPFTFAGVDLWFWGIGREGISVDGSYDNTIVGNVFHGNSAGGIFLYKNCGEYPDRPAYFERRYPSEHNLIEGNVFVGGTNGVWVGSRMGENTLPMDCTDPAYIDEPLPAGRARPGQRQHRAGQPFYRRHLRHPGRGRRQRVEAQHLRGRQPRPPRGDRRHAAAHDGARSAGARHPLVDNVSTIAGNDDPYRWVTGHVGTPSTGQPPMARRRRCARASNRPARRSCSSSRWHVAGPGGGPPATTPDLTFPVLGELPPVRRRLSPRRGEHTAHQGPRARGPHVTPGAE